MKKKIQKWFPVLNFLATISKIVFLSSIKYIKNWCWKPDSTLESGDTSFVDYLQDNYNNLKIINIKKYIIHLL